MRCPESFVYEIASFPVKEGMNISYFVKQWINGSIIPYCDTGTTIVLVDLLGDVKDDNSMDGDTDEDSDEDTTEMLVIDVAKGDDDCYCHGWIFFNISSVV